MTHEMGSTCSKLEKMGLFRHHGGGTQKDYRTHPHGWRWPPPKKQGKSEGFDSCDRPSNLAQIDPNHQFFSLCDLEIWWMTSINNRAPLLHYIKLCASFQIHRWIQTEVIVRKRSIRVKIDNFLSRVTLKFDGWSWKTIRHLFYVASSFVHHFIAISEFKLEL